MEVQLSSCCKIVIGGLNQLKPKLWLEKLSNSGNWFPVDGPIYGGVGKSFANLDPISNHGTYRVKILTPYYNEGSCTNSPAKVELFYQNGQFIGHLGTHDNTPYGGTNIYYTNSVIVGPSNAADIEYTFAKQ